MADLIDRKSAIDSIEKHLRFGDELYPLTETDKILNHAFEIAASCVYNLPSAQPEQTTQSNNSNTLNALDCVSRQYALGHYQYVCRRTNCKECPLNMKATDMGDTFTDCELELFLHNLPPAQPEPRWIPVESEPP